ncbi:conserved hypothetical protein [Verrucomicrobia bacterium]|nr:conserved hypothetical protein [Verrucomicrobiota bacterium]
MVLGPKQVVRPAVKSRPVHPALRTAGAAPARRPTVDGRVAFQGGSTQRWAVRPGGFSLIELLAVAAVLLILTTMYWGSSSGSEQRQRQKDCQKNLEKVYVALQIYANDYAGSFPVQSGATTAEEPLDALVPRYTVDTASFICPGGSDWTPPSGESIRKRKISYAYYMGRHASDAGEVLMSDRQVDTNAKAAGQYVFSGTGKPPGNNHNKYGGNLLFCDGHVDRIPPRAPFPLVATQGVVLLNPRP